MGLKSYFTQELSIDLGTANTVIVQNDKFVIDEPSIIAIDVNTKKVIAVGNEAQQMHGKTHANIKTIRPLKDGVIADFFAAELMLREFIRKIKPKRTLISPMLKLLIAIPSGSTEVEIRAVRDSSEQAGAREVYLIYEPLAAAIGIGLDIEAPEGNIIIDIGGGTTEIAVISLAGIVCNKSIRTAGDTFTSDIIDYMREQYNMKVGERTAEEIKINVGAAIEKLDNPPPVYVVRGPSQNSPYPLEVPLSYEEIAHCLDKSISRIESAIMQVLNDTPPELYKDIAKNGAYLTGGGAQLRGIAERFQEKFQLKFQVVDDPLHAVARGTGIVMKNLDKFQAVLMR
ncbi:MAG: rod shape-determining protein [Bacteroidales bacterium]|nr:rod shape-determining protein [Bacteroidales bacterium]